MSSLSSPRRRAAYGFTLIEVMLAVLLLALLLAGTFGAIRTVTKSMHSGEAAIDRTNRVRVAQEFLRRQVSRILPLSYERDEASGSNFVFEGDGKFMRFVAPMPGYLSNGGPYVQTFQLSGGRDGTQLLFSNEMLNGFDPEESKASGRKPVTLLDQIQSGHFQYRTLDENGELTDWLDEWDEPDLTPVMVRVVLTMRPEAKVTFPEMDIPLLIDAGSARMKLMPESFLPGSMRSSADGMTRPPNQRSHSRGPPRSVK